MKNRNTTVINENNINYSIPNASLGKVSDLNPLINKQLQVNLHNHQGSFMKFVDSIPLIGAYIKQRRVNALFNKMLTAANNNGTDLTSRLLVQESKKDNNMLDQSATALPGDRAAANSDATSGENDNKGNSPLYRPIYAQMPLNTGSDLTQNGEMNPDYQSYIALSEKGNGSSTIYAVPRDDDEIIYTPGDNTGDNPVISDHYSEPVKVKEGPVKEAVHERNEKMTMAEATGQNNQPKDEIYVTMAEATGQNNQPKDEIYLTMAEATGQSNLYDCGFFEKYNTAEATVKKLAGSAREIEAESSSDHDESCENDSSNQLRM
jgi:hypothetical protein